MKNKIKGDLSIAGINKIKAELQLYKQDLLSRTQKFCEELATAGIEKAQVLISGSGYAPFISLVKKVDPTIYGCEAILIMEDNQPIISKWKGIDDKGKEVDKTAEVSPTLMIEFGSGVKASADPLHQQVVNVKEKVGRGTFPSEKTKPIGNENHAWQSVWYYKDMSGNWQPSSGVSPKMPMYMAYEEMEKQITKIGRKYFK